MRKIAIATPVKAGLDTNYMAGLVPVLVRRWEGIEILHYQLGGTCVSFARNELVHYARKEGCHEIVFIDSDMGWNLDDFLRLISHEDYDIIAGLYCKRKPGLPVWLLNPMPGAEMNNETGVCEVEDVATGFMKIKINTVFPRLEAAFPHLEFAIEEKSTGKPSTCWEFFRIGCDGPRTPEARLVRIKGILDKAVDLQVHDDPLFYAESLLTTLNKACHDEQPPSVLRGEDYFFCKMAREVGLKVFVDYGHRPIPHIGDCPFPIFPEMVGINVKGQVVDGAIQS